MCLVFLIYGPMRNHENEQKEVGEIENNKRILLITLVHCFIIPYQLPHYIDDSVFVFNKLELRGRAKSNFSGLKF